MKYALLLFAFSQSAHAGFFKDFCARYLIGDANIIHSTEMTDLWIASRNNNLIYMQLLEERYEQIANTLIYRKDEFLATRLKRIGDELRRVDPGCPAVDKFSRLEVVE